MSADNIQTVIESMFSKIDSDKSGSITQTEMDAVFKVFDADGNGTVSRPEWVTTFTTEFGGTKEQAGKIFCKLDKDGSGDISLAEISQLFRDMDADGNGNVTKEEFICVWLKVDELGYFFASEELERIWQSRIFL